MQRRQMLSLAMVVLAGRSLPALAQQEKRVRRIGFFSLASMQDHAPYLAAFRKGMAELGWVDGRDYVIDARFTNGIALAGRDLAAEIVATQPDLLLTPADTSTRLLIQRTRTIPIVFVSAQDPVGSGNAASLRQPGGNATGLATLARDLSAKRLQLLKEAFPRVAHVVMLYEPDNVGSDSQAKEILAAAPRLGIRITAIGLRQPAEIEQALKRGSALGAQAYIVIQGGVITVLRGTIGDRLTRLKIPAMFPLTSFVEAGGLMSYGPSLTDNYRRAAAYVDKILKGAKPGDLPIEQPTTFELVVNMKAAKAMGFSFPQSFLVRVDRAIE